MDERVGTIELAQIVTEFVVLICLDTVKNTNNSLNK